MSKIKLNKSSLSQGQKDLKNYKQFLPSLDLKRKKILIEKNKVVAEIAKIKNNIIIIKKQIGERLPMLASTELPLKDLLKIQAINTGVENIVGVKLPTFKNIEFAVTEYTYFNSPFWLEYFIANAKKLIELNIQLQMGEQRVNLLEKSLQTVTQRKNLFEKVLIPKTITDIRTIMIFLADNERAAIVRSKITKNKRKLK